MYVTVTHYFGMTVCLSDFCNKSVDMAKKNNEKAKYLAKVLFMNNEQLQDIAEKVGVSRVTVSRWAGDGKWRELRAARSVTRPELVNKLLLQIDTLLDNATIENPDSVKGLGDRLSKLAAIVEKLDKQVTVIDCIEVFMDFNNWLETRSSLDKELTTATKQLINRYQDLFVNEQFGMS